MIRHTLIYFLAYAAPGIFAFLSFSAYTRLLSPAEYAVYSVSASAAFFLGSVCFGWLRFSISRFQAENPDFNFLPFMLASLGIVTIVATPIVLSLGLSTTSAGTVVIVAIMTMTLAQALFDITQEMHRARHQSSAFAQSSILRSLVATGLTISAAYVFRVGSAVVFATATGFLLVGGAYIATHRGALKWEEVRRTPLRRFVSYGVPIAMSGLVISGNGTLTRLMVASALGRSAAGQFGAALDLTSQVTTMIASSVCSTMGPSAIRAYAASGVPAARRELATGLELLLAVLCPVAAGVAITAQPFAAVFSGHAFETELGYLLPLLVVSRSLNVFNQFYLHMGFQLIEQPIRQVICGATTLVVNLGLNYLLSRSFGLMGAAAALFLADICGLVLAFALLRPVFPMPFPMGRVARIAAAVAVMATICVSLMNVLVAPALAKLVIVGVSGAAVYAAMAVALDICHMRAMMSKLSNRSLFGQLKRI